MYKSSGTNFCLDLQLLVWFNGHPKCYPTVNDIYFVQKVLGQLQEPVTCTTHQIMIFKNGSPFQITVFVWEYSI